MQDVQVLVQDDDAVGTGLDDPVGPLLGQSAHVGHAHLGFSHLANYRDRLLPAGGIPAGAAVELVLGILLARLREDLADLFFRHVAR